MAKAAKYGYLYVFLWHGGSDETAYSLYALTIPHPAVKIPIPKSTTIATTTSSTGEESIERFSRPEEPPRRCLPPRIIFDKGDWPEFMTCVGVGSRLWFFGGTTGSFEGGNFEYPTTTYWLNTPVMGTDPRRELRKGPPMKTGKIRPISFEADGKIYVLSGRDCCPYTGVRLNQFEILNPLLTCEWSDGKAPPFNHTTDIGPFVIVNRHVIIFCYEEGNPVNFYSYNLDSDIWSPFDTSAWNKVNPSLSFHLEAGSQFMGDSIYTSFLATHQPCHMS